MATVFLGIAFATKSAVRSRVFGAFGCLCFVVYGIFLGALPVVIPNALLLAINIGFIVRIKTKNITNDVVS